MPERKAATLYDDDLEAFSVVSLYLRQENLRAPKEADVIRFALQLAAKVIRREGRVRGTTRFSEEPVDGASKP